MNGYLEKLLGRLKARYQGSGLQRFLRWWGEELRELAPERWLGWLDMRSERLLVDAGEREWVLYRVGGESPGVLERLPVAEDPELSRRRLPALLAGFEEARPGTVLCLPADNGLVTRLSLPAAAEENLAQVLKYEMDRQTPFKADQVYFDFDIVNRDSRARSITLDLVVIPRGILDGALEKAAARGLVVDAVDLVLNPGEPPEIRGVNLLPKDRRTRRSRARLKLNAALGAAAVLLLGLAMWQSLAVKASRVQVLEGQVADARKEAMEVAELRKQLEDAVKSANFLVRKKENHPVLLNVLREVTHLLPDDTWLVRLQLNDGKVQLYGESSAASRLIGMLDDSPMLSKVSFISPVTTNTQTGNERFNLQAQVVPPDQRPAGQDSSDEEGGDAAAAGSR